LLVAGSFGLGQAAQKQKQKPGEHGAQAQDPIAREAGSNKQQVLSHWLSKRGGATCDAVRYI
jgi:hypothetical protein